MSFMFESGSFEADLELSKRAMKLYADAANRKLTHITNDAEADLIEDFANTLDMKLDAIAHSATINYPNYRPP
jgi:hypothetical protein